jgi:SAM-dependent methyltransferase
LRPHRAIQAFVFLGAVLLFSLEPLVGRMLLPRFGGAFYVWTTALMFFQGVLFVAYLYAHVFAARSGRAHLVLVALPLIVLPVSVGAPTAAEGAGVGAIVAILVRQVALPFVVLASTAVVAQRWTAAAGREPYGLYAISNAGSLGALLGYALVIEPLFGLETQRWAWMALYVAYALCAVFAWHAVRSPLRVEATRAPATTPRPPLFRWAYWALLSAAPSAFLMGVTNLLALDVGSVSLVWVVPLALYLGTFVVAFASPEAGDPDGTRVPGAVRRLWPHVAAVGLFFYSGGDAGGGWIDVSVHLVVLTVVCLAAHAELYRARPAPEHLTLYYLVVAAGGWLGGAVVALLAPVAFTGLYEYPLALGALAVTLLIGRRTALRAWLAARPRGALLVSAALAVVIVVKIAASRDDDPTETLAQRRSFYGLYRVTRMPRADGPVRDLVSGNTRHGRQREGDITPLSYYHPRGPLGDALALLDRPRRVAVVGLGVGAAAGHLEPGERLRFFEIDPVVIELARAHFTYLSDSRAEVGVVEGDARIALARDESRYDLLLVDAFSGDAIPTHLLTREALRLYLERLAPDGVLLLHVSNRYYDLRGVLGAAAPALGLAGAEVARITGLARDQDPSQYVALARDPARLQPLIAERGWQPLRRSEARVWTDDHANVLDALSTVR